MRSLAEVLEDYILALHAVFLILITKEGHTTYLAYAPGWSIL